jgi:hypothetical protein
VAGVEALPSHQALALKAGGSLSLDLQPPLLRGFVAGSAFEIRSAWEPALIEVVGGLVLFR